MIAKIKLRKIDNLLLNLSAGLDLKDLTKAEIRLLIKHFGKHWKLRLGYWDNLEYLEEQDEKRNPNN